MTPQTLVKAGKYNSPLEEAVKKLLYPIAKAKELGNFINYFELEGWRRGPYLFVVSQKKDRKIIHEGYNVLLAVTSYSNLISQQVKNRFEKETGIYFDFEVPDKLKKYFEIMSLLLWAFEENPIGTEEILRGE